MKPQTNPVFLRKVALIAMVFVLLAALFVLPPVRAFAEGVLHQVGAYSFQKVNPGDKAPFDGSRAPSAITIVRSLKPTDSISVQVNGSVRSAKDAAGIGQMVDFPVLTPSYLPAGYTDLGDWYLTSEGNGEVVFHAYRDSANHFFGINQLKHGQNQAPQMYAKEQIVDVTVNRQKGVWLPSPANEEGRKDALVWDEGGITYSIITDSLPLEELMKVAQSLSQ